MSNRSPRISFCHGIRNRRSLSFLLALQYTAVKKAEMCCQARRKLNLFILMNIKSCLLFYCILLAEIDLTNF